MRRALFVPVTTHIHPAGGLVPGLGRFMVATPEFIATGWSNCSKAMSFVDTLGSYLGCFIICFTLCLEL